MADDLEKVADQMIHHGRIRRNHLQPAIARAVFFQQNLPAAFHIGSCGALEVGFRADLERLIAECSADRVGGILAMPLAETAKRVAKEPERSSK